MHLFAKFLILLLFLHMIHCDNSSYNETDLLKDRYNKLDAFDGVYTECFLYLSYNCLQRKTLLYLKELDGLSEVPIVGDYLKFVKTNNSIVEEENEIHLDVNEASGEELSQQIDKAVDKFFKTHAMKISALGKEVLMPNTVEEFVGRKKKGGGGGGGGHGHGGDDGGKKKMMMMAMMCMKMKMMVMVPAMMGMMGMMSFKGMMFSMMSFMISKMMLLMKLLEKKNSFSGAGGDPGWATGGGGGSGGAWMPAAGPEYGGGGGYDSNAQWQRRSILSKSTENIGTPKDDKPIITYVKPHMRYNNINKPYYAIVTENKQEDNKTKSRKKRGIVDVLQNAYLYWMNKMLGLYQPNYSNKKSSFQRYRVVNGVKYVYYPSKLVRSKTPKELQSPQSETTEFMKPIAVEDYNKGEIQDEPESRMIKKKINKMVTTVNDTMDQDPWQ